MLDQCELSQYWIGPGNVAPFRSAWAEAKSKTDIYRACCQLSYEHQDLYFNKAVSVLIRYLAGNSFF
jgi:hypothetical protein